MTAAENGLGWSPRARRLSPGLIAMVLGFSALGALAIWLAAQARTSSVLDLDAVRRLAAAGGHQQALAEVEAHLRVQPDDAWARVIAAELALDQPTPEPERALEHLGLFRSGDPILHARAKLAEGKALYLARRYDQSEACWLEALQLDPKVPEAAWALLDLYYLEGRGEEARRLALRQHAIEPDPRDRARFLVELVRQDAEPPDPASIVAWFEPAVRHRPAELHAALALGLALVHSSRVADGLEILSTWVKQVPESADAWDALLQGLNAAGRSGPLAEIWREAPAAIRDDPLFARHEGNAAQARGDWPGAARAFRLAWTTRPDELTAAYRLARALHALGRHEEAAGCDRFVREAQAAMDEIPGLYVQLKALPDLGLRPHPAISQQLAENRDRLGRREEASAWRHLDLGPTPGTAGTAASSSTATDAPALTRPSSALRAPRGRRESPTFSHREKVPPSGG
jgi:tetratricopeptide (TPR) repeat protein